METERVLESTVYVLLNQNTALIFFAGYVRFQKHDKFLEFGGL